MSLLFILLMYYSCINHISCLLQKVETTVENLEVELAALLDAMENPKWRPHLDNTGKTVVDILEDPTFT